MRASTPKAVSEPKTPGTGPAFRLPFDNSFFRDMQGFYVPWKPEPSPAPAWVQFNDALALELGLEPATLKSATGLAWLSGVEMPAEAAPLAQAYAGHQFGQFSPHLGDGRALLLGELIDTAGQRRDLALKGSGRTPFSRRGDGKAALGPALREYLMGEAMHALGIPTTRALAVIRTGERVNREGSPPGAILVRVAASHLRLGTFEFFAAREEEVMLRRLLDYAVARHDPALAKLSDKPIPMLEAVCERQAQLIARWMGVGFIHGVMNTDNMSISGETIDYGPCAFMEGFDPATVFSSIDRQGRYAYGQQPAMAQWNLARLAEALLPVLDARDIDVVERVEQVVAGFAVRFDRHWTGQLRAKLGLAAEEPDDRALADDFLQLLQREKVDFTLAFRLLSDAITGPDAALHDLFGRERPALSDWLARWRQRMAREGRTLQDCAATAWSVNPFVIPRNHQVEAALSSAVDEADLGPFERLLAVLGRPYETVESARPFTLPASPEVAAAHRTFCGT